MKKIPVSVRVLRAVATTMPNGAKVKDIVKITGMVSQSVSACLWKLKDQGKIDRDMGYYKTVAEYKLTGVNKPVEADVAVHVEAAHLESNDENKTLDLQLGVSINMKPDNPHWSLNASTLMRLPLSAT